MIRIKVLFSIEFKAIKDVISALPIEELAGSNRFPANVPDTPPSKNGSSCSSSCLRGSKTLKRCQWDPV